jgi:hypothetical protein
MEKQSIIKVQANPKTYPGGVHGARFNCIYHVFSFGLEPIKKLPTASAPKFKVR